MTYCVKLVMTCRLLCYHSIWNHSVLSNGRYELCIELKLPRNCDRAALNKNTKTVVTNIEVLKKRLIKDHTAPVIGY